MTTRRIFIALFLVLAAVTTLALSRDSAKLEKEKTLEANTPQGEFYRGADEQPVHGVTPVDARVGGAFQLKPVLQGDTVTHDFLVKNTWKTPLTFKSVKSCCGVILTGHPPVIAPGETGKFSIVILTDKFGGTTVSGKIAADPVDPEQTDLTIGVSLFVNRLASVSRFKIILEGSARKKLEESTFIVPEKNHPFTVKGIKARKGLHIVFGVVEKKVDGRKGFLVTVKNTLKKPGLYRDTLYVMTDDPRRPEIRVRVEGRISE